MAKLILDNRIENKINSINFNDPTWAKFKSIDYLLKNIILKLNENNNKFEVSQVEFKPNGIKSSNYGYIEDDEGLIIAYVFIVPPGSAGRNIVAQNVMGGIYHIIQKCNPSRLYTISDKPCILLYINEDKIQKSKAQEIISCKILGFKIIDIFNRLDNENELPIKFNTNIEMYDISLYNDLIKYIGSGSNKYFEINYENNLIILHAKSLNNGETNERYFYAMKVFPILYLGSERGYKFEMAELEQKNLTMEPIVSLINFVKKHNNS